MLQNKNEEIESLKFTNININLNNNNETNTNLLNIIFIKNE